MIDEADRDGDGEINQDEFMRIMRKTVLLFFFFLFFFGWWLSHSKHIQLYRISTKSESPFILYVFFCTYFSKKNSCPYDLMTMNLDTERIYPTTFTPCQRESSSLDPPRVERRQPTFGLFETHFFYPIPHFLNETFFLSPNGPVISLIFKKKTNL